MCSIAGMVAKGTSPENIEIVYLLAEELQHRGQESTGIIYSNGKKVRIEKSMGLVAEVLNPTVRAGIAAHDPLFMATHTRYSTSGSSTTVNAHPFWLETDDGRLGLATNGNIPNLLEKRKLLESLGREFYTDIDAEFMLKKIYSLAGRKLENILLGIKQFMKLVPGTYCAYILKKDKLFLFRDPYGNRPLSYGWYRGNFVFASETCALQKIGAVKIRDLPRGSILEVASVNSINEHTINKIPEKPARCIFEYIYFSRPDSCLFGRKEEVSGFRYRLGKRLATVQPVDADFVTSVPSSGDMAAMGYHKQSSLPFYILLLKNAYIPRTFIMPGQSTRDHKAKIKYSVLRDVLKKRPKVVIVDDSIVRGTTARQLMHKIRKAGAKEIHLRISSPPFISPCYYGINTPDKSELIAANSSIEEIRDYLEVDSLAYLGINDLNEVIKEGGDDPECYCQGCFTGNYRIPLN